VKTASGALIALLNGSTEFLMADLYTFTLATACVGYTATSEPFTPTGTTGQLYVGAVPITASAVVSSLYRTDWQGTQLLYATARTNYAIQSQAFDVSPWGRVISGTGVLPTIAANYAAAPDGTNTASRVVFDRGAGTTSSDYSILREHSGTTMVGPRSFWLKSNTGTEQKISFCDAAFSAEVSVGTSWAKYSVNSGASTDYIGLAKRGNLSTSPTADLLVWGASLCDVDTSYIPTTTAAVSITDYSCTDAGAVTLGETASGTYTWSGSGESESVCQVIPRFMGDIAGQEPGAKSVVLTFKSLLGRFGVQYPPTTFQPICNNYPYDYNCGLSKAAYTETLTVLAGSTADAILCAPAQAAENYYSLGVITFTTGALTGQSRGVRGNTADGRITLLQSFSTEPATGDHFTLYPGCNRTRSDCSTKFANEAKFRGYRCVPRAESIL